MKLTLLGTGNALVTKCYNTCFVLQDGGKGMLVDGGGGNGVLRQLEDAGIDWRNLKDIFVTHSHVDHILGIVWIIRVICQEMNKGKYEGGVNIYGHDEVIRLLRQMSQELLIKKQNRFIDDRVKLIVVEDKDVHTLLDRKVTFFDIHSTKTKQFGFMMELKNGERFTCCGDEPYNETETEYVKGSTWLLHEAFCLYSQADVFRPYEKHHSTVREASQLAQEMGVKNLVLYHTEDQNISKRKELYSEEAKQFYTGNVFVPDDLDEIDVPEKVNNCSMEKKGR